MITWESEVQERSEDSHRRRRSSHFRFSSSSTVSVVERLRAPFLASTAHPKNTQYYDERERAYVLCNFIPSGFLRYFLSTARSTINRAVASCLMTSLCLVSGWKESDVYMTSSSLTSLLFILHGMGKETTGSHTVSSSSPKNKCLNKQEIIVIRTTGQPNSWRTSTSKFLL